MHVMLSSGSTTRKERGEGYVVVDEVEESRSRTIAETLLKVQYLTLGKVIKVNKVNKVNKVP